MENHHQQVHVLSGSNPEKERIIKWLVPVIMMVVIGMQVGLRLFTHLSSWKGGGFGMFSTVSKRAISCRAVLFNGDRLPCRISFAGTGAQGPLTEVWRRSFMHNPKQRELDQMAQLFLQSPHQVDDTRVDGIKQFYVSNVTALKPGVEYHRLIKTLTLEVIDVGFNPENNQLVRNSLGIKGEYGK